MRVLIIHNSYKVYGGEDSVVKDLINLLEKNSNDIYEYKKHNDDIKNISKFKLIFNSYNSIITRNEVKNIVLSFKPDVAHVHNIFPLISPGVYNALYNMNIPIVQTLHNYRFMCPKGLFYVNDRICLKCLENNNFKSCINNRCYHNSYLQSIWYSSILNYAYKHKIFHKIDKFIALNSMEKEFMIRKGFESSKIEIIPNYTNILSGNYDCRDKGNYIIYIGRLSREKGILTLLKAMKLIKNVKLKIVGDGEMRKEILNYINLNELYNVELLGFKDGTEKENLIAEAKALIFPSEWYETFGLTIIEAFALGTTVIATDIGGIKDIVKENINGLLFPCGNYEELANRIKYIHENEDERKKYELNAYKTYENKYTDKLYYNRTIKLYEEVIMGKNKGNF